jgi:hypothetical protein
MLYTIAQMMMSRRMRLAGNSERTREKINAYRVLVRRPEGKRQLRRPRYSRRVIINWSLEK